MEKILNKVMGAMLLLLLIGITIFGVLYNQQKKIAIEAQKKAQELNNLLASTQDTLETFRDREGLFHAVISRLETSNKETFLELQAKNKEIIELQALIRKNANQIKNPGDGGIILSTVTIIDTFYTDNTQGWEQRHISKFYKDDWIKLSYFINHDTTGFKLNTLNKYEILLGTDDKGKKFAEITNLNPYTETTVFRTYQLFDNTPKKPKERWGIGISAGGFITEKGFSPGIGVTINRNILTW